MRQGTSRGGTRGGKAHFNWDDVKTDKYRDYYLGHSLNAPVGRWQNNRNLQWYVTENIRNDNLDENIKSEIEHAKKLELEAFASLLSGGDGKKTSSLKDRKSTVTVNEVKEILKYDMMNNDMGLEGNELSRFNIGIGMPAKDNSEFMLLENTGDLVMAASTSNHINSENRHRSNNTIHNRHHHHRSTKSSHPSSNSYHRSSNSYHRSSNSYHRSSKSPHRSSNSSHRNSKSSHRSAKSSHRSAKSSHRDRRT